uniref:ULP_PROTEASE domain-containing protein n=1 Tax=Macrostomum lignano TaxID=282301 RepID=A0A1I8FRJ8_9PLAT
MLVEKAKCRRTALYLNVWTRAPENQWRQEGVMLWIFGRRFLRRLASLENYDWQQCCLQRRRRGGFSMQYRNRRLVASCTWTRMMRPGTWAHATLKSGCGIRIHRSGTSVRRNPSRVNDLWSRSWRRCRVSLHMLLPKSRRKYFSRANHEQRQRRMAYWAPARIRPRARHRAYIAGASSSTATLARANRKENYWLHAPHQPGEDRLGQALSHCGENQRRTSALLQQVPVTNWSAEQPDRAAVVLFLPARYDRLFNNSRASPQQIPGVVKNEGVFWIVYALSSFFLPKTNLSSNNAWRKTPPMILAKYFMHSQNHQPTDCGLFGLRVSAAIAKVSGFNHWTSKDVLYAFDEPDGDNTFKCPVIDFAEFYLRLLGEEGQLREQPTPNQPEGTRNIQEHIMTWPPYRMGNRSQHCAGIGENLRRRKCNFWNAQMRNIRNYMQQNVPCITEPKEEHTEYFWRVQGDRSRQLSDFGWPGNSLCSRLLSAVVNAALRNSSESTYLFWQQIQISNNDWQTTLSDLTSRME